MAEVYPNPINVIRTSNHKSLQELADLIGVHLQTLYLNECGCYPDIVPKIRTYLVRVAQVDGDDIDRAYKEFQTHKRKFFAGKYSDKLETLPDPNLTINPMRQFREHIHPKLNRTKFSKELCIEPAGMYRLEMLPLAEIPGRIRDVLLEIGISKENVEELQERIYEFNARR